MAGGHAWHGGVHGRGACMACMVGGHVWRAACMAGGVCCRGACMAGSVHGRRGMHGRVRCAWWGGCACQILRDTVNERRYASYWNAFLFKIKFLSIGKRQQIGCAGQVQKHLQCCIFKCTLHVNILEFNG